MLLMKKIFFEAIRDGRKTTTLRYWRRAMVKAGSLHSVRGLGKVRIEAVGQVAVDALTDADAKADGLAGLAELSETLAEIYTDQQRQDRALYKVSFTYLGAS